MSDDRANRLRSRRQDRSDQSDPDDDGDNTDLSETTQTEQTTDGSEQTDTSDTSETSDWADGPLKEVGTEMRMYLPDDLVEDLDYHFTGFYRDIKHEHGIEIEKNRHWYPMAITEGMENLVEMNPDELLAELRKRDYIAK